MAWSKLGLYNAAAIALGETPLSSITETVELRRKLDAVYNRGDGAIAFFMEQGHWNFAMRATKIDKESAISPAFGFANAFAKPTDFRKLNMIAGDEYFSAPLTAFEEEGDYWYANVDPIYVRYVSDDAAWGGDFAKWPETFGRWAGHWLALEIAPGMTGELDLERLAKRTRRMLVEARSNDATGEPTRFPPLSSWASARLGGPRNGRDRGSRTVLIG